MIAKELSDVADEPMNCDVSANDPTKMVRVINELSDAANENIKIIRGDIEETNIDYEKKGHLPEAIKKRRSVLKLLEDSREALGHAAYASSLMFKNINENKLSKLYWALGYCLNTGELPKNYSEIRKLNLRPAQYSAA